MNGNVYPLMTGVVWFTSNVTKHYFSDINDCAMVNCQNSGTCEDEINGFTCTCVPGYTGEFCETGKFSKKTSVVL